MSQEELSTAIFIAQIESFIWGGMLGAIVSDVFRAGVNTLVRGFRAWRQHRDLLEAIERDKARIKKEAAQ